jgi:hypothetical protein
MNRYLLLICLLLKLPVYGQNIMPASSSFKLQEGETYWEINIIYREDNI